MNRVGIVLFTVTSLLGTGLLESDRLAVATAGVGLFAVATFLGIFALGRYVTRSPRPPREG